MADAPVEAAPLSRIVAEVEASVRAASKGRPREEVDSAVRRAVGDAAFQFILFLRLNSSALEIADHEGLRTAAAFYLMGSLLGGPRPDELAPDEQAKHASEQAAAWGRWRSIVANLLVLVMVEQEAREELAQRYLGGLDALLSDAEEAWQKFAEQVDRLWSISEALLGAAGPESAEDTVDDASDPLAERVHTRARHIADDARIATLERLGEMSRAVALVECRLRL